jgi:hypothetical protein
VRKILPLLARAGVVTMVRLFAGVLDADPIAMGAMALGVALLALVWTVRRLRRRAP